MRSLITQLLQQIGEDPTREGLRDTPARVEKSLSFLTSGYQENIDEVLNNALFTVDYSEMVIVKDIDFFSLCEHHLLPFFGKCHVAYIPRTRVIGLSKIPRVVDVFSHRLQVQERLTNQIAETIRQKIDPMGVAVVMEATHLCMAMRGVEKSLSFLTSGYGENIDEVLNNALFTVDYSEMVIVKDIDFFSLCEHHLLPFFGKCHVAYIPKKCVIGLSKIPRLVDVFSRRLQVQERLTNQIAETIRQKIDPMGVAVVMEATHLCMAMRGVEKQRSFCVTSAMLGAFRERDRTRAEFLELIRHTTA
jgi:GTP cyclohydrolase I